MRKFQVETLAPDEFISPAGQHATVASGILSVLGLYERFDVAIRCGKRR